MRPVSYTHLTALLEQVGLEDKLDFFVDGLSRGMKQRLCLARALIHDPAILILDEPTSGLDPRTRFEFREILKELQESGKTIVISSHVLSELSELCTDIGIIDQGRICLLYTAGQQIEAVWEWVRKGGVLLIGTGERGEDTLRGFGKELLPFDNRVRSSEPQLYLL